ncbi:MAG: J domain-containing protein, partial [Deltaproteobacteria bacterium]
TPLAMVLISALKQKVTGELTLTHAQGQDRIYFQSGIPTGTQVLRAFKPLGRLLLELGWIDLAALEKSIELMGQGRRQGEALVEIGAVTREQLEQGLRLLQVRNLCEMARLSEGELLFEAAKPPPAWAAGVPPNALRILREVLAVDASFSVVDRLVDRLGGERTPVRIPAHLIDGLKHFDLDDDEEVAAKRLSEPKTLAAFYELSGLSLPQARALVAELGLTGLLVTYGVSEDTGRLAGAGSQKREEAREARARLEEIGSTPQASVARRVSVQEDRDRRRRLLQRGMAGMGPDRLSRSFAGRQSQEPPQAAPVAPPPPAFSIELDDQALSAEERGLESLVRERIALLPQQDLFQRLGLTRAATVPQIKSAFVKAVQLFHPDHLPPKLAHLQDEQRQLFTAVKEAYDVLSDDAKRRDYLSQQGKFIRSSPTQGSSKPREEDAKIAAFRGDMLLQKKDFRSAADAFHTAYQLVKNGDYLASEAWAILLDPDRKGESDTARSQLLEAATKHPEAERPCYYLAVFAKMDGRPDEAEELFQNVLRINPRHIEAGQELRLLAMRKKKGTRR